MLDRRTLFWRIAATSLLINSGCKPAPAAPAAKSLDIRRFGASGSAGRDDTRAFQAALDSMAGGGVLRVPAGTYGIDMVKVRHRGITIQCDAGVKIEKLGPAGPDRRGIFFLDSLLDARFALIGGEFDLRGEGPNRIGEPDLLTNRYAPLTIPTIVGIAGPANAVVYALRSSHLRVEGCTIANSGEDGLLFRNCGDVIVRDCGFTNIANYAIEFSLTDAQMDGGSGPMPRRDNVLVSDCRFSDIDDYALGSGNGGGIGGGGTGETGALRNYRFSNLRFDGCHRDIHFEFLPGSWIENLIIENLISYNVRQGSIGLVSCYGAVLRDIEVNDPGSAPASLLIPQRPEIFGIVLSSGFSDIRLERISITDNPHRRLVGGQRAFIERGSRTVRVDKSVFRESDTGSWFGMAAGNPGGTAYVSRIREIVGDKEAVLDLPAGTRVRGGPYAFGGVARNGIVLTAGDDVTLSDVHISAGSAGDARGLDDAAALRLNGMNGRINLERTRFSAPDNSLPHPAAISVSGGAPHIAGLEELDAEGFVRTIVPNR